MKTDSDHNEKNITEVSGMDFDSIIKNNEIENTLLNFAAADGVDIMTCKISQFKALLIRTGAFLFPKDKNILKLKIKTHVNNNIPVYNYIWDIKKLSVICDIYLYLSYKYNKIISFSYYALLCNSNYFNFKSILYNNNNYKNIDVDISNTFNNLKIYIIKRLTEEREETLKEACIESAGAIGKIAVGNTEYNWNVAPGQRAIQADDNSVLTIGQLPTLDAIGTAEDTENGYI